MSIISAIFLIASSIASNEAVLVQEGVSLCRVVLPSNPTPSELLAKSELEKYFSVATGCKELNGTYPIKISTDPNLKEDTFKIDVSANGLVLSGGNDRAVMYAAYELLKRFAGMRWITPGESGEFCVHKSRSIRVPLFSEVQCPKYPIRTTIGNDINAAFWHARNGMQTFVSTKSLLSSSKEAKQMIALGVKSCATGGHILSAILIGGPSDRKSMEKNRDALFAEHPEYFPLVDGKRIKIISAGDPNPCISNPEVLDRMADNLSKLIEGPYTADAYITIGNNDTTRWCECDNCRKLDPPETQRTRGELSDRYWFMVNEIARRVWVKHPNAKLGGWAYQNFWYAPVRVKPDPRLRVMVSFNNQCWRHACDDPKCPVNKVMVDIFAGWKKLGLPLVINRDEIGAWDGNGSPGCEMAPAESVLYANIRAYEKIGCGGSSFCVNTPFPEFSKFATKWSPFFGKRYHWYAMWQTCYMSAKALWNPDCEYEKTLEEANSLYYGAAWDPAMKEFRALLDKAYFSTPGCIGWGQGSSIGRCLDMPGSEERLVELLGKAVEAAKKSGDERVIKNVLREKEIFELTWLTERKRYIESYREMNSYKRTGDIVIDGVLNEKDWVSADSYVNFKLSPWVTNKFSRCEKTYFKVVYDHDNLYFGVVAMEPNPEKIIAGDKVDRFARGVANLGNHIELFYSYPDMAQASWHLMINSKGQIIDALQKSSTDRDASIVTKAKWAVKVFSDRWVLEVRVPCSEIGQNILDGMTWKVNCCRVRKLEGMVREELSTAANGYFHGTANFVNVKFVPKRSGNGAKDVSSWKNAPLNDLIDNNARHPNFRWKKWRSEKVPRHWSATGVGETKEHPQNKGDYYLSFSSGEVSQYFFPVSAGNNRLKFRARGKGKLRLVLLNYTNHPDTAVRGYLQVKDYPPTQPVVELSQDWKEYSFDRKSLGVDSERISVRFICSKDSTVELDDVYMSPSK